MPECLAIVGANFAGASAIRLRGSDDGVDQVVNPIYYDLPLYEQDPVGEVLRWYLPTTPTSGMAGPRRYWGVRLRPAGFGSYNTVDPWFEMACVWLGTFVPLVPLASMRVRPKNPSTRTFGYARAKWSDPLPASREAEATVEGLTPAGWYALEEVIRAQGERPALLDLHAASSDPVLVRGGCLYGGFADDPVDGQVADGDVNELRFRFEEAAG